MMIVWPNIDSCFFLFHICVFYNFPLNSRVPDVCVLSCYVAAGHSVVVEVSPDIHICGFCKQQYNNFEVFLAHKQNGCSLPTSDASATTAAAALTGKKRCSPAFIYQRVDLLSALFHAAKPSIPQTPALNLFLRKPTSTVS